MVADIWFPLHIIGSTFSLVNQLIVSPKSLTIEVISQTGGIPMKLVIIEPLGVNDDKLLAMAKDMLPSDSEIV